MGKILIVKDGKHGLGYEYFLTKVFQYFGVPLEAGVRGIVKQMFSLNILVESEYVEGKTVKLSRIFELLAEKEDKKLKTCPLF